MAANNRPRPVDVITGTFKRPSSQCEGPNGARKLQAVLRGFCRVWPRPHRETVVGH